MSQVTSSSAPNFDFSKMSDARRILLEQYLRGKTTDQTPATFAISRRSSTSSVRMSFSQERLWFLDQLMPGSAIFNVPLAVRISTSIDDELLTNSINEIVRRHEVLRTTFVTEHGSPIPVIAPELKVPLTIIDLSGVPPIEAEEYARHLSQEEAERPFAIATGPLIRATLIVLSESDHVLVITLHHICSDGWSLVLFFEELTAVYDAFSRGEPSPLKELPIQYADYAAWNRDWLQGPVLNKQLAYWKEKLSGELPILNLPTDRARPAVQTYRGARVRVSTSRELTDALNLLSQKENATLFMTLLAAFKVLLFRNTGDSDLIVGSPIATRPHTETERLIGFFLNNLALRTDLGGNPSFKELLTRVRQTALDAYAHQDVPFEKLIEEVKPKRDLSRTTIFQVYFNLFSFTDDVKIPGTDGQSISFFRAWSQSEENLSKFDLTMYAGTDEGRLQLALVYNTDLFDEATIKHMLDQYLVLLESVVADPEVSICTCPMVRAKSGTTLVRERDFVVFEKAEIEQSLAERFSVQVKRHSERLAVKTKNYQWTYQELKLIANRIARAILAHVDSNKENRVALLFEHDAPMIAAMLGVLKAGSAYVPLDASYPVARLVQILQDADAEVLLTNGNNQKLAAACVVAGVHLINIDGLEQSYAEDVNIPTKPTSLAYLLYTSGSTGHPKGVMQNHRNVLHFIRAYTNNLKLNEGDRLTLLSSYCFDASVMDIYGALLNGATLYPIDIKREGFEGVSNSLRRDGITVYHSTPTVYRHFVKGLEHEEYPQLRLVVLGGEPVTRGDVDSYKRHFGNECVMINGLGPTEATVSLQYFIDKQTHISGQNVPVGYPVTDTEVLLLDKDGNVNEVSGEIALKCPYVALGYWRNETATATAFSRDSTSNRIYRTGDLGKRLPDGSILFIGRKDSQVKIRGFRVELSEIETLLSSHPDVRENVVVLRETGSSEKHLVAYLVRRIGGKATDTEFRSYLRARLPEYMVPTSFVMIEALPLTASGKVNRLGLPEPGPAKRTSTLTVPSHGAIETVLAALWAEVLGVNVVGPDDNFFELGGHSLLAVLLFARIVKYFGKRLPLATLFQAPTVAQLAAIIKDSGTPAWSALVPIQPAGPKPPFFCVHAKGGNVLEYYDLSRHLGTEQPFYGLQSQGLNSQRQPHTRIADMAADYIREMREVQPVGPYFIGGRSLGGTIAFEMACQLGAAGEEVALLALLDTYPAGYLNLLPDASAPGNRFNRLLERLRCHYLNLASLPVRQRIHYLIEKARYCPARVKTYFWRKMLRLFEGFGRRLPRMFQSVEEFNSLAAAEYVPCVYRGAVTLFWASADRRASFDLVDGWRVLAPDGIDVQEISGSHLNLIKEPYVTELAQKLKTCLNNSQQRQSERAVCHPSEMKKAS